MLRVVGFILTFCSLTSGSVIAADDDKWWFDVEVVLFARNTAVNELPESFQLQQPLTAPQTDWDLITQYLQPDIQWIYTSLPVCNQPASPLWVEAPTLDEIVAMSSLSSQQEDQSLTDADIPLSPATTSPLAEAPPVNESLPDPMSAPTEVKDNHTAEPIVAPRLEAIAAYWLELTTDDLFFANVTPKERDLSCREHKTPQFVAEGQQWHWQAPNLFVPLPEHTPLVIHGADWERANEPHLLSDQQFTQQSLFTSVRWRKGIERLAHLSWRQQVKFGQDNAETLRLYAGKNYAQQFTNDGERRAEPSTELTPLVNTTSTMASDIARVDEATLDAQKTDAMFNELRTRLANPHAISYKTMTAPPDTLPSEAAGNETAQFPPLWELDGFIQIFLKYINSVPYLHINSELHYRQPVALETADDGRSYTTPDYELISVPFKQLRRVISTQLHYFDHPLFGMVVQIRRYERPVADNSELTD